ncbi:MAG TPA: cupin [Ramlibacter sp.]|nr:cupin [Ramlibacter sp.]
MQIRKTHAEFYPVDMDQDGWEVPAGYPQGIEQKILSGVLDEDAKQGFRTRLLRFKPGIYTTAPFMHDYWEEVYLVEGDLVVGNDAKGQGGTAFAPHTYACRPPATPHGPFKSTKGCVLLELHYYGPPSDHQG